MRVSISTHINIIAVWTYSMSSEEVLKKHLCQLVHLLTTIAAPPTHLITSKERSHKATSQSPATDSPIAMKELL